MRHIDKNMLLPLRERIFHNTSMSRRRQLNRHATFQVRLIITHTSRIITNLNHIPRLAPLNPLIPDSTETYPGLTIRLVIQQINRGIHTRQRHLSNKPILGRTPSPTLMHHTNTRNISIWRPPTIQNSRTPIRSCGINAHLRNAERTRSTNEDISASEACPIRTLGSNEDVYVFG